MPLHVARFGLFGHLGRFRAADASVYPRRSRVVLRTPRGLETGQIVLPPPDDSACDATVDGPPLAEDGRILRRMTVEDELLEARLLRKRDEAFAACQRLLADARIPATLVDVEHLLDGQGLYFYFLGDPPEQTAEVTRRLADVYEATVEFRRFADTLAEGCGPGCGTEAAAGQGGCSSCAGCAVAGACGPKIKPAATP
jgi:cell fate regulator YaaT (PSP1 superfamily)